jgi:DNA-binding MarR family transcriptional regulator
VTSGKKPSHSHIDEITKDWKRERPDLDLGKFFLAIYMQRLGRMIEQNFERMCQTRLKMRASDVRVLLALRRAGPPFSRRPTDLFRAVLVTSGAITKQVDRLEKKKLVKRLPDPEYGGGFLVQLTDRGRKLVDEVVAIVASGSMIEPALSALSAQERDAATRFCYRAISLLENAPVAAGKSPGARAGKTAKKAR